MLDGEELTELCKLTEEGQEYIGSMATTVTGHPCLPWNGATDWTEVAEYVINAILCTHCSL